MNGILIVALLVGLCLLVFGYVKNNRNLLAAAAILILIAAGAQDFAMGFQEGYSKTLSSSQQPAAANRP